MPGKEISRFSQTGEKKIVVVEYGTINVKRDWRMANILQEVWDS